MLKKRQVVMLPTNEKAELYQTVSGTKLYKLPKAEFGDNTVLTKHLYFLSDEEIKEGEWMYHSLDKRPIQRGRNSEEPTKYGYKKIIATTDSSLKKGDWIHNDTMIPLPQPSQSFLEVFMREYNKGNVIKEVMLEYEERPLIGKYGADGHTIYEDILKVNSKDNTITIKRVKESWSREEVIELINDFASDKFELTDRWKKSIDKWLEQNL